MHPHTIKSSKLGAIRSILYKRSATIIYKTQGASLIVSGFTISVNLIISFSASNSLLCLLYIFISILKEEWDAKELMEKETKREYLYIFSNLKWQCREIFWHFFISLIKPIWTPDKHVKMVSLHIRFRVDIREIL